MAVCLNYQILKPCKRAQILFIHSIHPFWQLSCIVQGDGELNQETVFF